MNASFFLCHTYQSKIYFRHSCQTLMRKPHTEIMLSNIAMSFLMQTRDGTAKTEIIYRTEDQINSSLHYAFLPQFYLLGIITLFYTT